MLISTQKPSRLNEMAKEGINIYCDLIILRSLIDPITDGLNLGRR